MPTSRGLTALFYGPPGTGKTMVAGVIARELGLDMYRVDLARVVSKWVGETEKNLAEVFDAAEDSQVLTLERMVLHTASCDEHTTVWLAVKREAPQRPVMAVSLTGLTVLDKLPELATGVAWRPVCGPQASGLRTSWR